MKRVVYVMLAILICTCASAATKNRRPIIGISASQPSSANINYINAVKLAGGVPLIIPFTSDDEELKAIIKTVDAIVMTGGEDVEPYRYGESPIPELGGVYPERDEFDIKLTQMAVKAKLPLLGVCRGVQVLNVAFGGSLWQDIPSQLPDAYAKHKTDVVEAHKVEVVEGSVLYELIGGDATVNSLHHQSVKALAPGFKVSAISEDGVIEGIEKVGAKCVMGVQFHPEIMVKNGYDSFLKIFQYIVEKAR